MTLAAALANLIWLDQLKPQHLPAFVKILLFRSKSLAFFDSIFADDFAVAFFWDFSVTLFWDFSVTFFWDFSVFLILYL